MMMKFFAALLGVFLSCSAFAAGPTELLNVSYDPTRELYTEYNAYFTKMWRNKTSKEVIVRQSHGGSGKQARAVIEGLRADVVTMALAYDIDVIAEKAQLLPADWQKKLPHNSAPYTSTIVFLVRKGNPKNIKDWGDLVRDDVKVITANPKTSGGARWNYMAAWGWAMKTNNNDEAKAKAYMSKWLKNVPVLDIGARGATTTFVQRGMGDVLLAWENEAYLAAKDLGKDSFDIVRPSMSILAEPAVAIVEKNVDQKKTREIAEAYLQELYSKSGQEIVAKHYYRPTDPEVLAAHKDLFPDMQMMTVADFGGWSAAQKKHFADGALFDQVYSQAAR